MGACFPALLALAFSAACLPQNNLGPPKLRSGSGTTSANSLDGLGTGLGGSSTTGDGAKPPCDSYATSDPTRLTCVACYQQVLSEKCPTNVTGDAANCVDQTVVLNFSNYVNQCISASIVAGFTCTLVCGSGQVLNLSTCSCITAPPEDTGTSVNETVDTGQTDFGPPIVTAMFPSTLVPSQDIALGSLTNATCEGAVSEVNPIWLNVRNRGDTVARMNQYNALSTTAGALSSIIDPIPVFGLKQANALTAFRFTSNGTSDLTPATSTTTSNVGGGVGTVKRLSATNTAAGAEAPIKQSCPLNPCCGGGSAGCTTNPAPINFSTDSTTLGCQDTCHDGTAPVTNQFASTQFWTNPWFATKDKRGNLFISDRVGNNSSSGHTIWVICYDTNSPWCSGATAGHVVKVAGAGGTDDWYNRAAHPNGVGRGAVEFDDLAGFAIDSNDNIYVVDKTADGIGILCGTTGAGPCKKLNDDFGLGLGSGTMTRLVGTDTGNTGNTNTDWTVAAGTTALSDPWGVDVETSGNNVNLYVTEPDNNRIRMLCSFSGTGPCRFAYGGWDGATPGAADVMTSTGLGTAAYPLDVKIHWTGNLYWAEYGSAKVGAQCTRDGYGDPCDNETSGCTADSADDCYETVAGTGVSGDSGDAGPATSAKLSRPIVLVVSKTAADDVGRVAAANGQRTRDNNILVLSKLERKRSVGTDDRPEKGVTGGSDDDSTTIQAGNAVRVICGDNSKCYTAGEAPVATCSTAGATQKMESQGFCENLAPYSIHRITGQYGQVPVTNGGGNATGTHGLNATYATLEGMTYDRYNNLVVTSTYFTPPRQNSQDDDDTTDSDNSDDEVRSWVLDNNVTLIHKTTSTNLSGAKFSFRDSNQLTSYYCMRVKTQTECHWDDNGSQLRTVCECKVTPPNSSGLSFWLGTTSSGSCP
jgi:hypothetical protein